MLLSALVYPDQGRYSLPALHIDQGEMQKDQVSDQGV
jgi:hypothetical protein